MNFRSVLFEARTPYFMWASDNLWAPSLSNGRISGGPSRLRFLPEPGVIHDQWSPESVLDGDLLPFGRLEYQRHEILHECDRIRCDSSLAHAAAANIAAQQATTQNIAFFNQKTWVAPGTIHKLLEGMTALPPANFQAREKY
jgi:hypothetical protein